MRTERSVNKPAQSMCAVARDPLMKVSRKLTSCLKGANNHYPEYPSTIKCSPYGVK
ncbi:hypothetical protein J6590_031018 [Homalodisca vitripennis]|nr:hypothetical protein J6590_031018 [Homalodisca vitripennis]